MPHTNPLYNEVTGELKITEVAYTPPTDIATSTQGAKADAMSVGDFDRMSFDVGAGGFDGEVISPQARGGLIMGLGMHGLRSRDQIKRARKKAGLPDREEEAAEAIASVAAQQAQRLELDKQKQFDELSRELQLRGIEWDARYLESLNYERERLINAEIALRLRLRLQDEEELMLLVLMAAACA